MSNRIDTLCKAFVGCVELLHPGVRLAKESIRSIVEGGASEALTAAGQSLPLRTAEGFRTRRESGERRGELGANNRGC